MVGAYAHAIKLLCSLCMALVLFPVASNAETFVLATGEYPPYVSSTDPKANMATEIVSAALQAVGHDLQLETMPWARCELEVLNNNYIGTFPFSKTPDREAQFMFSETLYMGGGVFFFNKNRVPDFKYTDDEALSKYKLGLVRGYNWNARFLRTNPTAKIHNNLKAALRQLKSGHIEILPEGEYVGWYTIKKLYPQDYSDFGQCKVIMNSTQSAIMISKGNPRGNRFLKVFNEGMAIIDTNGTLKAIRSQYKTYNIPDSHL